MVDRNIFTKMAKKVLQSHQGVRGPKAIHPARDWMVGLFLASIILVASVTFGIYEYKLYRDITVTDYSSTEEVTIYRANMVDDALRRFTERDEEHQLLLEQKNVSIEEEFIPQLEETEIESNDSGEGFLDTESGTETEEDSAGDEVEVVL